jgi:WD40 repeat protein
MEATPDTVSIAAERFSGSIVELLRIHQSFERGDLEDAPDIDPRSSTDADSVSGSTPPPITEHLPLRNIQAHTDPISNIAMAPESNLLGSTSPDTLVRLWVAVTGTLVHTVEHLPDFSVISPDHGYIVYALRDGGIRIKDSLCNIHPERVHIKSEAHDSKRTRPSFSGTIHALGISKDGETIASGYDNGTLILWDFKTGALKTSIVEHPDTVTCVAFAANSAMVAFGSRDGRFRV